MKTATNEKWKHFCILNKNILKLYAHCERAQHPSSLFCVQNFPYLKNPFWAIHHVSLDDKCVYVCVCMSLRLRPTDFVRKLKRLRMKYAHRKTPSNSALEKHSTLRVLFQCVALERSAEMETGRAAGRRTPVECLNVTFKFMLQQQ